MGLVADDGPVRVVLVDDHPVVRAGLRALLDGRPDDVVVGEAVDAASARDTVHATAPDVVLIDLNLGAGPGGTAAIRDLATTVRPPPVLVLTTYQTEADVLAALDAGASAYLLKDAAGRAVPRGPGDSPGRDGPLAGRRGDDGAPGQLSRPRGDRARGRDPSPAR
jgi:CheY-like chemotaxis protein